jgi:hypothetical protein
LEPLGGPIDLLAASVTAATNQTYNTFEVSRSSTEHKSNFMKTAVRIYRNHYFIDFHWRERERAFHILYFEVGDCFTNLTLAKFNVPSEWQGAQSQ